MNNISLIQPDPSDIYDINTFNNNFQTIQDAVNNIQYTCDTIQQQKYSLYTVSDNSFNIDSLSIESGIYYFNIQSGTVLGTLPDNNINLNNAILLVSVGTDNSILQYMFDLSGNIYQRYYNLSYSSWIEISSDIKLELIEE